MRCGTDYRTDYFILKAIQRNVGPGSSEVVQMAYRTSCYTTKKPTQQFHALLVPHPLLAQTCVFPPLQMIYKLFPWVWVWRCLKHNHKVNAQDNFCTWLPKTPTLKPVLCCSLQSSLFERKERIQVPLFLSIPCIYLSVSVERTKFYN